MANTNVITHEFNEAQITMFDHLTTDELINKALRKLKEKDSLALALLNRLMDLQSEVETYQEQLEAGLEGAGAQVH